MATNPALFNICPKKNLQKPTTSSQRGTQNIIVTLSNKGRPLKHNQFLFVSLTHLKAMYASKCKLLKNGCRSIRSDGHMPQGQVRARCLWIKWIDFISLQHTTQRSSFYCLTKFVLRRHFTYYAHHEKDVGAKFQTRQMRSRINSCRISRNGPDRKIFNFVQFGATFR